MLVLYLFSFTSILNSVSSKYSFWQKMSGSAIKSQYRRLGLYVLRQTNITLHKILKLYNENVFERQTLSCFTELSDSLFIVLRTVLVEISCETCLAPCFLTLWSNVLQMCFTQLDATRSATYSTVFRVDAGCPWKKLSSSCSCTT